MSVCRLLATLCLLPLMLRTASAAEEASAAPDPVRLSGFATLGLTHSDNPDTGLVFSHTQKHPAYGGTSPNLDSVLGLQFDLQLTADTSVLLQGVARVGNDMRPEARMAFLRHQFKHGIALRAGRIRSPMYFDSDVAEIGYAYLMVRQPMPLYAQVNSSAGIDGADLQWRHAAANAAFLLQGYYGSYHYQRRFDFTHDDGDIALNKVRGLALSLSLPSLTARASRTWIGDLTAHSPGLDRLNAGVGLVQRDLRKLAALPATSAGEQGRLTGIVNSLSAYIDPLNGPIIYTSVGFDSTVNDWRLLGETVQTRSAQPSVGRYQGYHLTAGYNLRECTPYVSVAREVKLSAYHDTTPLAATAITPVLDRALAILKGAIDAGATYADLSTRSVSVGMRYDFQENRALKLQYDRLTTPGKLSPGIFAVAHAPINNRVNLVSVALDVVF